MAPNKKKESQSVPGPSQPQWPMLPPGMPGMMQPGMPPAMQGMSPGGWWHPAYAGMYGSPAQQDPAKGKTKKPWSSSSSDDDDDEDEDLRPSKKGKKRSSTAAAESAGKKKRGRPSKADLAARAADAAGQSAAGTPSHSDPHLKDIVARYPSTFKGHIPVAFQAVEECGKCSIYKGELALIPCGHHKYCYDCVNKLKAIAEKKGRPFQCPNDSCFDLITSWVKMYHVNV